jgi:hypothetical protein
VRAEDLLVGPRGQYLCWALTAPDAAFTPGAAMVALADAVAMAAYWQEPHEHHLTRADISLQPVAEQLIASGATARWDDPIAVDDQHIADVEPPGYPVPPPRLSGQRARLASLAAQHTHATPATDEMRLPIDWRSTSATWWSAPIAPYGLTTTRSFDGVPLGLTLIEDAPSADNGRSWPVHIAESARILELSAADDWVDLVRRYPLDVSAAKRGDWWRATGRDGRWLMPDWHAVAAEYDGVHLSIAGYLTTAGRALGVDDQFATALAGWDPDATYFLNDVVQLSGEAADWVRDPETNQWGRAG